MDLATHFQRISYGIEKCNSQIKEPTRYYLNQVIKVSIISVVLQVPHTPDVIKDKGTSSLVVFRPRKSQSH